MQNTQPKGELDAWYQEVKSILEHPGFQNVLEEIKSVTPHEALQIAFTQLTPKTLVPLGVPIPEGTIISIRASQDATIPIASTTGSPIRIRAMICLPFVPQWFDLLVLEAKDHSSDW